MDNDWKSPQGCGSKVRVYFEKHLLEYEAHYRELADQKLQSTLEDFPTQEGEPQEACNDSNLSTLREKFEGLTDDLLEMIDKFDIRVTRTNLSNGNSYDSITRPMKDVVLELRNRGWPGNRTALLGENGLGKSFLLNLILQIGCPGSEQYSRNNEADAVLEAVQDEALRLVCWLRAFFFSSLSLCTPSFC